MGERRQVARREPIEAEVEDGRVFVARPLPWMKAADLGNEIIRQNAEAVNETVRVYMEGDIPQIEASLGQKIRDWEAVLRLAYPDQHELLNDPRPLDSDEAAEVVLIALEVNHLEHLRQLVDPNSPSPTPPGGIDSLEVAGMEPGAKTASTPNSSSQDSAETPSSASPAAT